MNQRIKIGLYFGLLLAAVILGFAFYRSYSIAMRDAGSGAKIERATATEPGDAAAAGTPETSATKGYARMMAYGAGLFLIAITLAMLLAHDFSKLIAHRFERLLFSDEGEAMKSPEYEQAEQVWQDGNPLEAIQLMRDYLKSHPREQYVALRIAEIYEKDLQNWLAAALEYEEVLTHKLSPDRWGWAAIHLANLYSGKLNQPEKAVALLRRIETEYSQTAAAEKARKRLAQFDTQGVAGLQDEEEPSSEPKPGSNLPPGFRPLES